MRALTCVVLLAACGVDQTEIAQPAGVPFEGAVLVGDIPGLEGLNTRAKEVLTEHADAMTRVTVVVDTGARAGMAQLELDPSTLASASPTVSILACSGPRPFVWEYDQVAHDVTTYAERDGDDVTLWFRGAVRDFRGFTKPDSDAWTTMTPADLAKVPVVQLEGRVRFRAP